MDKMRLAGCLLLSIGLMGGMRAEETSTDAEAYLVQVDVGTGGTLSLVKNGAEVAGDAVWATSNDTVVVTATAAEGMRFLQWTGGLGSFAPGSYAGDTSVTLHPTGTVSLTALWTAPKTRTWNPTVTSGNNYLFKTPENWLDETGATGAPLIGDTVVFGATSTGAYRLCDDNSSNPLYEVRYEDNKTVSMNQGSFALLAGGRGLQYLRNANSGSNWSGLRLVGDGLVPVNIVHPVNYVMQKGCVVGSLAGYRATPTVVKQGPGTVINCNQSGNYSYTVPTTLIQEGRWDLTLTTELKGCVFGFDGPAAKSLTFCYGSYTTDLNLHDGGLFEVNGAANHVIGANGKPYNVVFTGTPKFNPMVFSGAFTQGAGLTWSPDDAGAVFVCSNAVSDTAGRLVVSKGTVKLVAGATFTSLSELSVASDAVFAVEAGSGAALQSATLVLGGPTAKLRLAEGVTLAVTTATLAGAALSPGTYAATADAGVRPAAWIEGAGTVTVAEGPGAVAVWCGGDAESALVTRGANWQDGAVPDFATGDLLATFAAGGAEARLDAAAAFDGLALNNAFGGAAFAFTAEPGASATVNVNGIRIAEAATETTWTMGWPLTLGTAQTWTIGANNTLALDAPLAGGADLVVENAGTLVLNAASAQTGALELKGGTVKVTASNGLGPAGRTVSFHHGLTKYVLSGNLVLDAPMFSDDLCESWASFMTVEPDARVTFNGNFGYRAEGGITFGAGSVTVFKGGLRFVTDGMKGKIIAYGSGTVVVSNNAISACRSWVGQRNNPLTLELCVPWNALNDFAYWAKFPCGRLVTRVANAVRTDTFLALDDTVFDLDGHDQTIGLLATTAKTRIASAAPATLTVASSSTGDTQDGTYGGDTRINGAVFEGCVSFRKTGSHPHTLGGTSTATGAVEVAAGTLTLNAAGNWPNATEVRVAGGTLAVQNAAPFGTETVWRVAASAGGTVQLDNAGTCVCRKLVVDGANMPGGVYGAVGSGAQKEVAWITGSGFLRVAPPGLVITVK